jgi:hypothetical protein
MVMLGSKAKQATLPRALAETAADELGVLLELEESRRLGAARKADLELGQRVQSLLREGENSNRILAPVFYAMHDTLTPVTTGMLAVGVNIATSLILMGPLGPAGLALATAVSSASNFVLLFTRLRRRIGPLGLERLALPTAKVGLACLPMAAWAVFSQIWWDVLAVSRAAMKALLLCGEVGVAVGLFAATAAALRCEEVAWALALLRRRGSRESKEDVTSFQAD